MKIRVQATAFIDEMTELWKKSFSHPETNIANIRRYFMRSINATIVKGNAQILRKFCTQMVPPVFPEGSFHWPALNPTACTLPLAVPDIISPLQFFQPSNSQQNRDAIEHFLITENPPRSSSSSTEDEEESVS